MQIKKSLSIVTLTGILVINASSYSFSQSSEVNAEEQAKDRKTSDYTIKKGDTLWDISEAFLKNPFQWPYIWENNAYIRNPDLIFPGNKLIIPPVILSIPESGMEEAPVSAVEATLPEQAVIPAHEDLSSVRAPFMPTRPKRAAVPATPPVVRPAISSNTIESGGYIINNIESYGVIKGSREDRTIFADGDSVNISLENGYADKVSMGDKYTIFRTSGPVIHPATKKKTGFLLIPIGVIKINRVQGKDASGEIIKSYNYASIGDRIQPYIPADPVLEIRKSEKEIQGYIIDAYEGLTLNAQFNIVYLDKGASDGITPGTILYVITEKKDDVIGELQVVSVQDTTSTALVTRSVEPFGTGSKVTTIIK